MKKLFTCICIILSMLCVFFVACTDISDNGTEQSKTDTENQDQWEEVWISKYNFSDYFQVGTGLLTSESRYAYTDYHCLVTYRNRFNGTTSTNYVHSQVYPVTGTTGSYTVIGCSLISSTDYYSYVALVKIEIIPKIEDVIYQENCWVNLSFENSVSNVFAGANIGKIVLSNGYASDVLELKTSAPTNKMLPLLYPVQIYSANFKIKVKSEL